MTKKGFAKLVIAVGVLIMIVGMNMDVTVSSGYGRVANIHLISQRQMLMMFGGFIFLGGLVLFAVARMKQTPEDEAKEEADSEAIAEARKKKAEAMVQQGAEAAAKQINALRGNWQQMAKRLFAGFCAGVLAAAIYDNLARLSLSMAEDGRTILFDLRGIAEIAIIVGIMIYAFRSTNYLRAVKAIFAVEAICFGLFLALAIVVSNMATLNDGVLSGIVFFLITAVVAFGISARSEKRQLTGSD
ncbi:MAG: hypothetical protein POELPBGB_04033 [Bacteroidia bacterium]|nr:hypothetical protein [Bacteroidia bacterium]